MTTLVQALRPGWSLLRRPPRDETATGGPRPRPHGPVLMGDLTTSWGGRPVLLSHWDRDADDEG